MTRRLVVTADDFGAAEAVNDAVEAGHRRGVLTAASLMVAAPGSADAVARARRTPSLRVGLHLVLVEGRPLLAPSALPDLVTSDGLFRTDMARLGAEIFFIPRVRRQLAAEIEAQFAAFAAAGLPLDHVNTHKHYHLHPTIAGLILRIGRRYGLRASRAPIEPRSVLARVDPTAAPPPAWVTEPWARLVRARYRRAGVTMADQVFGLAWSGDMTPGRVAAIIRHLPAGLSELYLHPATGGGFEGAAPGYRYADEFQALCADDTRAAVRESGAVLGAFADFI
jgi:hopanoid biosynthesis associated protein HpnK